MRKISRATTTGAAVVLALAGGLTMPSSASATALVVNGNCYVVSGHDFQCDLTISGGTLPYTTTWTGTDYSRITWSDTYHALGKCTWGGDRNVWVDVKDAAGASAGSWEPFPCYYDG